METYAVCPHCGKMIRITINESAFKVDGAFFDRSPEDLLKKVNESGYEFGQKGGE